MKKIMMILSVLMSLVVVQGCSDKKAEEDVKKEKEAKEYWEKWNSGKRPDRTNNRPLPKL